MAKKETAPLATNGTAHISCGNDSTISADVQGFSNATWQTYNEMLRSVTENYLQGIDLDCMPFPSDIEYELLTATNHAIEEYNLGPRDPSAPPGAALKDAYPDQKPAGERARKLRTLVPWQVSQILMRLHHVVRISLTGGRGDNECEIAVYVSEGEKEGIYDVSLSAIERLARAYNPQISIHDVKEVLAVLQSESPCVKRCDDQNLIAVNNGIFDYKNKVLMPFDPEYVFTAKSDTDLIMGAPNPVIHNDADGTDWDVVSWMNELSDEPEVVQLLWEILGAIIRPSVRWNKSAWLYSTMGNNGKGTLCTLMRNLCGEGAWASISLKAFSQRFMLEPLRHVSAIITDENDTGTFVDDAAALKSVITGDPFQMDIKHKDARKARFTGFMVQCVNEPPRLKDRSESMYRRLLIIPMNKRFEGRERKYIKDDYLHRREVLEYVLSHLLYETDYYELSEPAVCVEALDDYRVDNDPVRQFVDMVMPSLAWDLVPWQFLYDLYGAWMSRDNPNGRAENLRTFKRRIIELLPTLPEWSETGASGMRPSGKMDVPELLIVEYDLKNWRNQNYRGMDVNKIATPETKSKYHGLVRVSGGSVAAGAAAANGVGVTPDGVNVNDSED